jgi:hypothetical protein
MKHISKTTGEYVECTATQRGCPNKGHMSDGAFALLKQNPKLNKSINIFNKKLVKNSKVSVINQPPTVKSEEPFKTVGVQWETGNHFPRNSFISKKLDIVLP